MPLSLKNPEAERLARALAHCTGESITDAVIAALRERLKREQGRRKGRDLVDEIWRSAAAARLFPCSTLALPKRSSAMTGTTCQADGSSTAPPVP